MGSTPKLASYDVAVVGAGPVGLTAALLGAQQGLSVVVLEQGSTLSLEGSRAICQQRDVLDVWETLIGDALTKRGVTWGTARTYYQDQELFAITLPDHGGNTLPPFINISQSEVTSTLFQAASYKELITVHLERKVTQLINKARFVELHFQDPTLVPLRASSVIVASGVHSEDLRSQLQISYEGESFDDRFLICDIRAHLPALKGERRFYFDPDWNPGRQVLVHEQPDDIWRIDWQVPGSFELDHEQSSGGLDARIRAVTGDQPYELVWTSLYRFQGRVASRFSHGNIYLVGDAAHVVAPFGARGLNSGVHDVENLVWKIAARTQGWGGPSLLPTYEFERRSAAIENLDVTSETMRFLVPHTRTDRDRRFDLLARAARGEREARDQIDSGQLYQPYWYSHSPLTRVNPDFPIAKRPARGALPPFTPGVLVPDAWSIHGRLRARLRYHTTVVCSRPHNVPAIVGEIRRGLPSTLPVQVWSMLDGEFSPNLSEVFPLPERSAVIIRPDCHVAAIVQDSPAVVLDALAQSLGWMDQSAITTPVPY